MMTGCPCCSSDNWVVGNNKWHNVHVPAAWSENRNESSGRPEGMNLLSYKRMACGQVLMDDDVHHHSSDNSESNGVHKVPDDGAEGHVPEGKEKGWEGKGRGRGQGFQLSIPDTCGPNGSLGNLGPHSDRAFVTSGEIVGQKYHHKKSGPTHNGPK